MKIFLTLTLFVVALASCTSAPKTPKEEMPAKVVIPKLQDGYAEINSSEYWLTYPSSWRREGAGEDGTKFTIYAPIDEEALFEDNLSLGTEALPSSTLTPKEYLASAKTMIGNVIENMVISVEEDVPNKYAACRKIEYTGNIQGIDAKWKQYVYIKNSTAYILTFTCMNTPESIKEHDAASNKILNSFILK